jgi:hypothetical protein
MRRTLTCYIVIFTVIGSATASYAQSAQMAEHAMILDSLYRKAGNKAIWYRPGDRIAQAWKWVQAILDSADD